MKPITLNLEPGSRGTEVANLQDALTFLLLRGQILPNDPDFRRQLMEELQPERDESVYADITQKIVSFFQEERGLEAHGVIDEPTATALNDLLRELDLLDGDEPPPAARVVSGAVRRADTLPVAGVTVQAFHEDDGGVIWLGERMTDAEGRYTIHYASVPGLDVIHLRLTVIDGDGRTLVSSDILFNAPPRAAIDLVTPAPAPATEARSIVGRVGLDDGRPGEGVTLRLYRRDFGGGKTQVGQTTALPGGRYTLDYDSGPAGASLQMVALRPDGEEVPLDAQLNYLGPASRVTRNVVAPADLAPRMAEFRRLAGDVRPIVGDVAALANAKETTDQQDLTALNRATGWDARLLALGALAARLSGDEQTPTSVEGFYGLLRAGLPSDKLLLAQVSPDDVAATLTLVRDKGIVQLGDAEIDAFRDDFRAFATQTRLALPVPGGNASYGNMLQAVQLDEVKQATFAEIFLQYGDDPGRLWPAAREMGLTEPEIGRLQLQGKLAFLTSGSQPMTTWLMNKHSGEELEAGTPLFNPGQLADLGLYTTERWIEELDAAASATGQDIDTLIPSAYVGSPEQRRQTFADDMARKVRVSYPMQVLAQEIRADGGDGFALGGAAGPAAQLLRVAADHGFRLGRTSVDTFFQGTAGAAYGLNDGDFAAGKSALKDLHATYQISTTDQVMMAMRQNGLRYAADVTGMPRDAFLARHGRLFTTIGEAALVYRKAEQVSSMVYNLFIMANQVENKVVLYGASAPADVQQSARNELIKHFPTLETLFGSMDFCECEHCRSVLSPAAYLVDLLQYIEGEDAARATFEALWEDRHGGRPYTDEYVLPYEALIERRPDLIHIPLTCENTHTALPYIDIVNEILEYYVAHKALAPETARDSGEATTDELLAEPQNVIREAYGKDGVRGAHFPLTLPFDLWLETVRQFCDYFEAPLAGVLEAFRPGDELIVATQPYDRATIFIESLGLSPDEAAIFTDPDPLAGGKWYGLYGYATIGPLIASPTNAAPDATLTLPDDEVSFIAGNSVTYLAATGVQGETLTVKSVGAAGSGGAGRTLLTLNGLWATPPAAGDQLIAAAPALLSSAKILARRLGVTYKELVDLVKTGFINPQLVKLALLYKLGATIADIIFYRDNLAFYNVNKRFLDAERADVAAGDLAAFDALANRDPATGLTGWEIMERVQALLDRLAENSAEYAPFDALAWLTNTLAANAFDDVLVLADPEAGCSFDATTLRYADGRPADAMAFLRFNLFVRLWRKLGWTMEETDRALVTFSPANTPFDAAHLSQRPLRATLIYLAHLKTLAERVKVGKDARQKLLTLWADLATTGKKPLYAQLFLTRHILKSDPVFDHPLGQYLSDPAVLIKDHLLALQGALGLTAVEIDAILRDADLDPTDARLTLPNVSLLYRYGLLAKGLKLSAAELIALKGLSGLNPFSMLHVDPPTTLVEDHPFSQTLAFVDVLEAVRESGLDVADLDYLLRHRFDPTGDHRPDEASVRALLRTMAEGIRAIRAEHAVPDDPSGLSDEVLAQKLGLVLPPDVVQRFIAMVNGTAEFTFTQTGLSAGDALDPAAFAAAPAIVAVSPYNETRAEQKLTYRGVLFPLAQTALETQFSGMPDGQPVTLSKLLIGVRQQARDFFDNQLKKQPLRLAGEAGFLDEADFDALFASLQPLQAFGSDDTDEEIATKQAANETITRQNQEELQKRRARIAQVFLPFLQARLTRQLVAQTLTAYTGEDPALVDSLLTDERLIAGPLLASVTTLGARGLDAAFFDSVDLSGAAQPSAPVVADADTALKDGEDAAGNLLGPANSANFQGYLEVPAAGAYRFNIILEKAGATAELRFDHLPNPVFLSAGPAATDGAVLGAEPSEFLELKPGQLYRFILTATNLNGGRARLLVQGETMPRDRLSQLTLYPLNAIHGAERTLILFTKAMQLTQALALTERELRYLLTHAADFGNVDFGQLPTAATGDTPAERAAAMQRFAWFLRLAAYIRLRRDLAAGTTDLIDLFEAHAVAGVASVYPLVARLARRESATVEATAGVLWPGPPGAAPPPFNNEVPLLRLWSALQLVERFGVPAASVKQWSGIVAAATTDEARFAIARDLREVIKARFEPEAWQGVAKPIFDQLRKRQRDALVAYVLYTKGFDRLEQLYDFFLIDPGMEPVVQTSRIRLAIASVQVFIQRCLLNLEAQVHPSAIINANQWEWMKRYRVWEANRKIFLFPENWLEPEFRDDKSHLFAELEGALLQGDVSRDLAEDAFLHYLRQLDELARLDIAAMHLEQRADPGHNVLHVIGRTFNEPHKYLYRRYAAGMWTPWEPMSVEIQGDHLAPVIWRDRLYLFWVTFMEKSEPSTIPTSVNPGTTNALPGLNTWLEARLHWSEYLNGEWTAHESSAYDDTGVVTLWGMKLVNRNEVFVHVSKAYTEEGEESGVYVYLVAPNAMFSFGSSGVFFGSSGVFYYGLHAFYLAGRNSSPVAVYSELPPDNPYPSADTRRVNRYQDPGGGSLEVAFTQRVATEIGADRQTNAIPQTILEETNGAYTLLPLNSGLGLKVPADAYEGADNPTAVRQALERTLAETESLLKPVFFQNNRHTIFIEPDVVERTVEEVETWMEPPPRPEVDTRDDDWLEWLDRHIVPNVPVGPEDVDVWPPRDWAPINEVDILTNPATVVLLDDMAIGPGGRLPLDFTQIGGAAGVRGTPMHVNSAGAIAPGDVPVLGGDLTLDQVGLTQVKGGINMWGGGGVNGAMRRNVTQYEEGIGAGMFGSNGAMDMGL